ncbi:MAG: molybdopterin molybdotransferase MoeA [Candidatus Riflebacteria bacterium]|nr:molybdopterin molybdotransferase MoeA [Candidatus Riflebacteria bacterium]
MTIDPDSALNIILNDYFIAGIEKVPVFDSLNRILADDIFSPICLPPFEKCAMDGYAYHSGSSAKSFRIIETIYAGTPPKHKISSGECSKIMTGAMVPEGADRVIPYERSSEHDGFMVPEITDHAVNICHTGENIASGELLFKQGTILRPQEIATLSAVGISEISAYKPCTTGIISTGSEILTPGQNILPGKNFDSNGPQLYNQAKAINAQCKYYGIVQDEPQFLFNSISSAQKECSIIIISGGVSKGDCDYVPEALAKLGAKIEFEQVSIKPGRPTIFAKIGDTSIFALPGNPVATFVLFEIFVKPLIYKNMGHSYSPKTTRKLLREKFHRKKADRCEFIPVDFDDQTVYFPANNGPAHVNLLCKTSGLLRIEKDVHTIEKDTPVQIRLF